MMRSIIIFLLFIIIITYYYYHYLQYHFWYNLGKNLGKSKFYSGKLYSNIYSKKDLTEQDKNGIVQLYTNYMEGVVVNKEKIEYFLSSMPNSEIFYMKVNSIYYGAVMNSIIKIKYKNKTFLSNFVDYAIINKNFRDKGIFKELMNYIANYSNKMNAKYVIFKIDRKPIPSFYDYQLTSNYYYCPCLQIECSSPKKEEKVFELQNTKNIIILSCPFENKEEIKADNWDNEAKNLGITNHLQFLRVSPFFKGEGAGAQSSATIMIFKRNSPDSIELLYIYKPVKNNMQNIIEYLQRNYSFKILFVDDIGNNSQLIKEFPELFKIAYPVYHYILGLKDKIAKENFFYYF